MKKNLFFVVCFFSVTLNASYQESEVVIDSDKSYGSGDEDSSRSISTVPCYQGCRQETFKDFELQPLSVVTQSGSTPSGIVLTEKDCVKEASNGDVIVNIDRLSQLVAASSSGSEYEEEYVVEEEVDDVDQEIDQCKHLSLLIIEKFGLHNKYHEPLVKHLQKKPLALKVLRDLIAQKPALIKRKGVNPLSLAQGIAGEEMMGDVSLILKSLKPVFKAINEVNDEDDQKVLDAQSNAEEQKKTAKRGKAIGWLGLAGGVIMAAPGLITGISNIVFKSIELATEK